MRRPGNLRGIGRLGHYKLGADLTPAPSFSPINRANPFGPSNPMPTTIYATPTGYSINNPNPTPTATNITPPTTVTAPPPAVIPTTPSTITATATPAPITPIAPHGPTCNCPQCASINGLATASPTPTNVTNTSTNSSATTTTNSIPTTSMPGITATYAMPIPGYTYPLPGIQTFPSLTTSFDTTKSVNIDYPTTTTSTLTYEPLWNKPKVKLFALAVIAVLAFRKD